MNPLLNDIATKASQDLQSLISEGEADIINAIHKMREEAQLQETSPKFGLSFKIAVDFDKGTFDCDLSWSFKQCLSVSHQIQDPNQSNLPIAEHDDTKVTLITPGKPVETTVAAIKQASDEIQRAAKR